MSSWVSALHVTHLGGAGKVFSSIEASSLDTIIIQNESLGLTIDRETATAHWHGEHIDYDHALMVAMASWDSGDTRPEAGPAAGDWNPS